MYFADLAFYSYRLPFSFDSVQCVGWLDSLHEYTQGDVSPSFVERLKAIVLRRTSTFDSHVNVVRGIHPCNFCGKDISVVDGDGRREMLGMSELWLPFQARYFAAPSLVCHYVAEHHYCPPDSFIQAVLELPLDEPLFGQGVYDGLVAKAMERQATTL